jgi:hypothetical protein
MNDIIKELKLFDIDKLIVQYIIYFYDNPDKMCIYDNDKYEMCIYDNDKCSDFIQQYKNLMTLVNIDIELSNDMCNQIIVFYLKFENISNAFIYDNGYLISDHDVVHNENPIKHFYEGIENYTSVIGKIIQLPQFNFNNISSHIFNKISKHNYIINTYKASNKRLTPDFFMSVLSNGYNILDDVFKLDILCDFNDDIILKLIQYYVTKRDIKFNLVKYIKTWTNLAVDLIILSNNFTVYKDLVDSRKINVTNEHLSYACISKNRNNDLIIFILKHEIIPNNENFQLIYKSVKNIDYSGITISKTYNSVHRKDISVLLDYFLSVGYILTYDDIKNLIHNKISLENIHRYNIKIDDEIVDLCLKNNFYPDYFSNYNMSLEMLRKIFLYVNRIGDLKMITKNTKINFDIECLRNACTIRDNYEIINYLIQIGVRPDLTCLKIIINTYSNETEKLIFNNLTTEK